MSKQNPRKTIFRTHARKNPLRGQLDGFATMPNAGFRPLFSCLAILAEKRHYS
jgi:hypothetical protein